MKFFEIEKSMEGIRILREDIDTTEKEFFNEYEKTERVCRFPRYSYSECNSAWGFSSPSSIKERAEKVLSDHPYGLYSVTFDYSFYRSGTAAGSNWYGRDVYSVKRKNTDSSDFKDMFYSKLKEYREIYRKYMQYDQDEMPSDELLLIVLMDHDIKKMKEEGE